MPNRRTFLIACGGLAAAPAFAHFGLPPADGGPGDLIATPAANTAMPALRIDGWDSSADSDNDVWIQINSLWRATWR